MSFETAPGSSRPSSPEVAPGGSRESTSTNRKNRTTTTVRKLGVGAMEPKPETASKDEAPRIPAQRQPEEAKSLGEKWGLKEESKPETSENLNQESLKEAAEAKVQTDLETAVEKAKDDNAVEAGAAAGNAVFLSQAAENLAGNEQAPQENIEAAYNESIAAVTETIEEMKAEAGRQTESLEEGEPENAGNTPEAGAEDEASTPEDQPEDEEADEDDPNAGANTAGNSSGNQSPVPPNPNAQPNPNTGPNSSNPNTSAGSGGGNTGGPNSGNTSGTAGGSGGSSSGGTGGGGTGGPSFGGGNPNFGGPNTANAANYGSNLNRPWWLRRRNRANYYTHNSGHVLTAAVLGYLFGRRRGRIKTERRLKPQIKSLERNNSRLENDLNYKERAIGDLTREKIRSLHDQAAQAEAIKRLKKLHSANTGAEAVTAAAAAEAARQPNTVPLLDQTGNRIMHHEVRPLPVTAENITPADIKAVTLEPAAKEALQLHKTTEEFTDRELLDASKKIFVDKVSLKDMYDAGRFDRHGLRRIMDTYLKGGDFKKALSDELIRHTSRFERDPTLRGGSAGASGNGAGGSGSASAVNGSIIGLSAGSAVFPSDEERPFERLDPDEDPFVTEVKRHKQVQNAAVAGVVLVVIATIVIFVIFG